MWCCTSSIAINLEDLRPYGFLPRMWNSFSYFSEIMARRQHARDLREILRRLVLDRNNCSQLLLQAQLDLDVLASASGADKAIIAIGQQAEIDRLKRHARHLVTMRSVADQSIRMITEERVGVDLMMTLYHCTKVPFIRYDAERWDQMISNLAKRHLLSSQQQAKFRELLVDMDETAVEEEEAEEMLDLDISEAPLVSSDQLETLARLSIPSTL